MIPVRLQLKNFMSYGESVPPLDLTGVRLACLSGDNGNGKSALLDAMTWALFGETRASSDDDIIRLGASDCRVLFDFLVGENQYRIHKARGKRGGAIWELQIWQEDGTTRSLSGTNARETKAKIEQILRMDYKTFVTSGYLAQGRADEFARATVTERKKVLADILDLSRYERLEQMAKDRRKDAEDRETDAERELRAIDAELENEDRYHLALTEAQTRRSQAAAAAETGRANHERLFAEVQRLDEREQKAREYELRIPEIEDEISSSARQLGDIQKRIIQAEAVIVRRDSIERAVEEFRQISAQIPPLEKQYDSLLALQREMQELENRIRDAHMTLDRERYRIETEARVLEDESREHERYTIEISRLDGELASFGDVDARRSEIEERRVVADDRLVELRTRSAAIKAQDSSLQTRLTALSSSNGSLCEYCGQPLSSEMRTTAIREAEQSMRSLFAQQAEVTALGREAKKQADLLRADAERIHQDLRNMSSFEARRAQATQELLRVTERTKTLPAIRQRMAALEKRIAEKDYAPAEQERRLVLSAQLEKLERVGAEVAEARLQLGRLQHAERDRLLLASADQTMMDEPPRCAEIEAIIAKRGGQIANARRQITEIRATTAELSKLRRGLADAQRELQNLVEQMQATDREIGKFTSLLSRCEDQKRVRAIRATERQDAARERDIYKELIAAFGKKGVQALIIENALPEIETQANELLGRMTDGGMQLRLVTQRESKVRSSGPNAAGSIETLDIIISDDMGTRAFEMYSGGEAFRINFAIRVALSRMLAKRAGAPLQTLILDEGFGTQDPRGREAIVDAINDVSQDFALVLVITHIDEMKEAFQTRIEVVKGPDGSTFSLG